MKTQFTATLLNVNCCLNLTLDILDYLMDEKQNIKGLIRAK
jgi:hypothetical protein